LIERITADGSLALIVFSAGIFVGAFVASGIWYLIFRYQESKRTIQVTPRDTINSLSLLSHLFLPFLKVTVMLKNLSSSQL